MKRYMRKGKLYIGFLGTIVSMAVIHASHVARAADEKQAVPVTISIDNFSFTPKEITVEQGTTVTWLNHDDVPHTVVSTDKKFRSKALDTDEQFSFTFADVGTYSYFCSVHPVMIGKIVVK